MSSFYLHPPLPEEMVDGMMPEEIGEPMEPAEPAEPAEPVEPVEPAEEE